MARRYALRDDQWARIKDLLPGRKETVGVTARDNRLFVEAVLSRYRAGIPWRDLPERFGEVRVLHTLEQLGKTAVIPPKRNRTHPREYDKDLYKARHLIENICAKLKPFRALATCYDKRAKNFLGAIYLAAAAIWLN